MTVLMSSVCFPGGHVLYPIFSPSPGEEAAAQRMNEFYRTLREAAEQIARDSAGSERYTAECKAEIAADGRIQVSCLLRLRHRGRTLAQKKLTHLWQNGLLIPPKKQAHLPAWRKVLQKSFRRRS